MPIKELQMPYQDFKLGDFIDPDQHDANNFYIQSKINEILLVLNQITDSSTSGKSGADIISLTPIAPFASKKLQTFLQEAITRLQSTTKGASGADFIASTTIAGVTGNTVQAQLESLRSILTSEANRISALTTRMTNAETGLANRYTKAEVDSKDSSLQNQITSSNTSINILQNQMVTHNHDSRYMTRQELAPYLQGGDTIIHIDVYTIVSSNNGNGTFTYKDNNNTEYIGTLGESGEQIFALKGRYDSGLNHIKAIIGDTLHRSVASGGLKEIDSKHIALTYPEGDGAEITIEYFERLGVTGEHNIIYGSAQPPPSSGSTMWFKVVG